MRLTPDSGYTRGTVNSDPLDSLLKLHGRLGDLGQRLSAHAEKLGPPRPLPEDIARLRVKRVDDVAGLQEFSAELDRLNAASARPNPFCSSDFLATYAKNCEYHPTGVDVRLFVVEDGGKLIAALPLRRAIDAFAKIAGTELVSEPRLELLATHDSEQIGIVCTEADEDRAARALIAHLTVHEAGWGILELIGQRPGGALHRAAHAAESRTHRVRDIQVEPITEIALNFPDLSAYFRSLVKKMRSNISRQARRLYATGEVELVLAEGPAAVAPWLEAYRDLDGRSWKAGTESSIGRHPVRMAFFRELVEGRAGVEPSFIGVVLDGVLIAGLIVVSNGAASPTRHGGWCLEMSYDQTHATLGPGQLLLLLATGEALARRDGFLNFLQNFAYYKHRWGAAEIEVVNVQVIRRVSVHNVKATAGDARRWWLARKAGTTSPDGGARPPEPDAEADADVAEAKTDAPRGSERAKEFTRAALGSGSPGLRRLDRAAARKYLPFSID
jgi:CelD/BcsL family acetyltransferase involved in cellulose biosynthesis